MTCVNQPNLQGQAPMFDLPFFCFNREMTCCPLVFSKKQSKQRIVNRYRFLSLKVHGKLGFDVLDLKTHFSTICFHLRITLRTLINPFQTSRRPSIGQKIED
jgi:hypothetical protein